MEKEIIVAIALGIGLSASTGFRVFLPLLIAGIAGRLGFLPLTENFSWLAGNTALVSLGVATLVEVGAYYIPFIDNLLDTISTPLAIGAGTLISASVLPVDNELARWITGFIVGGGCGRRPGEYRRPQAGLQRNYRRHRKLPGILLREHCRYRHPHRYHHHPRHHCHPHSPDLPDPLQADLPQKKKENSRRDLTIPPA